MKRMPDTEASLNKGPVNLVDTQWRSWSRHSATRRKVSGSIPDAVTGIFH